jgi:ubiquinone/menaquinone biosynthesis C-methylase UbiE
MVGASPRMPLDRSPNIIDVSDYIKDYWESQAKEHGESHWASWGDNWMIDLEIETIGKHIKDGDTVLDVGCANGYSTFRQASLHKLASITGVDFSANMIEGARSAKRQKGLGDDVDFAEGDVRSLEFPDNAFDVVYTTRVLINLPTWEQQQQGIAECIRVAKPQGTIVLSEGFWEPLVSLNALRSLKNLPPLVEHDFNRYLKRSALEPYLQAMGMDYAIDDFSSIYYLGSRFLRELVTDPAAYPGFSNPINKIFYEIEKEFSGGGLGIQQAVVVHKPADGQQGRRTSV